MFDARQARALAPGDHLTIPDAPGLRLVATATRRTWTYRYRSPADGRMRQIRLGAWPAMGLPAALAAWATAKAARDGGADPAQEKRAGRVAARQAPAAAYTVRQAADDWLARHQAAVAPRTYREAERLLRVHLGPLAGRPLGGITRADAYALIDGLRETPVQASALRQVLGAVWDRAHDAGALSPDAPNWWRLILRGKLASRGKSIGGQKAGPVKRVLTPAEVGELLRWMPNHTRDVADALTLYLWTCCRGAEILAMERAEIAADDAGVLWWTIPVQKLKMRRSPLAQPLRVPLVGRAAAIVRRRLDATQGSYLFPSRGRSGHIEQKAIGVAVWTHSPRCMLRPEWVRPRCPVDAWAPHDLRRTGRTLLAALGCPDDVGEAVLGHLQPGIVGVYNRHQYDAQRLLWLSRLADHLETLAATDR